MENSFLRRKIVYRKWKSFWAYFICNCFGLIPFTWFWRGMMNTAFKRFLYCHELQVAWVISKIFFFKTFYTATGYRILGLFEEFPTSYSVPNQFSHVIHIFIFLFDPTVYWKSRWHFSDILKHQTILFTFTVLLNELKSSLMLIETSINHIKTILSSRFCNKMPTETVSYAPRVLLKTSQPGLIKSSTLTWTEIGCRYFPKSLLRPLYWHGPFP